METPSTIITRLWDRSISRMATRKDSKRPTEKSSQQFSEEIPMKIRKSSLHLLCAVLAFTFVTAAQAPKLTFKFTTLDVKGANSTQIFGIGDSGAAVGDYVDSAGATHGVVISGKKVTTIDNPKATGGTFCYNVNSSGTIVGYYIAS